MGWHIFWKSIITFLLISEFCYSEEIQFNIQTTSVQWQEQRIELRLIVPISPNIRDNPSAEFLLRQHILPLLDDPLKSVLYPVVVDSQHTIENLIYQHVITSEQLIEACNNAAITLPSSLSEDLASLMLTIRIGFYPQLSMLLTPSTPMLPLRNEASWKPTAPFTGLVIYAADELPLYGANHRATLIPVILPKIYDETLQPVFNYTEIDPEALHFWGVALYTNSLEEDLTRVGKRPFRIIAVGLFGKYPTDLIISNFNAAMILANPSLRTVLQKGRIQIILANGKAK